MTVADDAFRTAPEDTAFLDLDRLQAEQLARFIVENHDRLETVRFIRTPVSKTLGVQGLNAAGERVTSTPLFKKKVSR